MSYKSIIENQEFSYVNGNRIEKGRKIISDGDSENVIIDRTSEYWVYTWDLYNRLTKAEQFAQEDGDECVCVFYEYDALNFRIKKKECKRENRYFLCLRADRCIDL